MNKRRRCSDPVAETRLPPELLGLVFSFCPLRNSWLVLTRVSTYWKAVYERKEYHVRDKQELVGVLCHEIVHGNLIRFIEMLIQLGCPLDRYARSNIVPKMQHPRLPLEWAIKSNHEEAVALLIQHVPDQVHAWCVYRAMLRGSCGIVRLLWPLALHHPLYSATDILIPPCRPLTHCSTCRISRASSDTADMVETLLKLGVEPCQETLNYAVSINHLDLVRVFIGTTLSAKAALDDIIETTPGLKISDSVVDALLEMDPDLFVTQYARWQE